MLVKFSIQIRNLAHGWVILVFITAFIIFMMLPIGDPELIQLSLDGRFGYTADQAFQAAEAYGETGRNQMLWIHLADFLLIFLYTSVFSLSISWLFRYGFQWDSLWQRFNLIPILGGFFDVIENIWIILLILMYPKKSYVVGWLASIFTVGKYLMAVPIFALILIGLVRVVWKKIIVKNKKQP